VGKIAFCARALAAALAALVVGSGLGGTAASAQTPPRFTLDAGWPKPLPNHWQIGALTGVYGDRHGLIWTTNQSANLPAYDLSLERGEGDCCVKAPQVIAFDKAGNVVKSWSISGPTPAACGGYRCVQSPHTIYVDHKDNVWVTGRGGGDSQLVKFDYNGKFLLRIGGSTDKGCCGNQDTANLGGGTGIAVWPATNEVFVTDGYVNRRVVVYDADTGAFKRMWGAYGRQPEPSTLDEKTGVMTTPEPTRVFDGPGAPQWSTVHAIAITPDGIVWIADRVGNRIQRFRIDGTYIDEAFVSRPSRTGTGTVYSFAFSNDPDMRFVYVADGGNKKVHILDRRTLKEVGSIGGCGGQMPGCFNHLHVAATDSEGTVYTGEAAQGARIQRWVAGK
jgi:hypothetical protein